MAASIVIGPLNVINQAVWAYMRIEGIWGVNKELEASKKVEIKWGILK